MHIKKVIIRGIKSFTDQTNLAEDFSPGTNAVVGFKGSGKSNFFQAILFVLSDQYSSLHAETRKTLRHEGAGQRVPTAYVEVILDNSDKRIQVDSDQVSIRRRIGVRTDDWFLDGRCAPKAEVFGLLGGAGFAKSNPCDIVQLGKVSDLALMTDAQCLGLLKNISGVGVCSESPEKTARQIKKQIQVADARREQLLAKFDQKTFRRSYNIEGGWRGIEDSAKILKLEKSRARYQRELTEVGQLHHRMEADSAQPEVAKKLEREMVILTKLDDQAFEAEFALKNLENEATNQLRAEEVLFHTLVSPRRPSQAATDAANAQVVKLVKLKEKFDEAKQKGEDVLRACRVGVARQEAKVQAMRNELNEETMVLQTLRGINDHFQQVFAEMVPGGMGKLQVIRRPSGYEAPLSETQGASSSTGCAAGELVGVGIEVSFTGQAHSFLGMSQLPLSQKTVVALSLMFAIQRLKPAPFFLLDGVDAALDTSYGSALGNLLKKTAKSSQVVYTAFSPELLDKADRCYCVYQQKQPSQIDAVTREQAKQVLREQDWFAQVAHAAG